MQRPKNFLPHTEHEKKLRSVVQFARYCRPDTGYHFDVLTQTRYIVQPAANRLTGHVSGYE